MFKLNDWYSEAVLALDVIGLIIAVMHRRTSPGVKWIAIGFGIGAIGSIGLFITGNFSDVLSKASLAAAGSICQALKLLFVVWGLGGTLGDLSRRAMRLRG